MSVSPLSFSYDIDAAAEIRPLFNVGSIFDTQCGRYMLGANGESIMNGGLAMITGIGGRANTYKSTLGHYFMLSVLNNYISSTGMIYDSELSGTRFRLTDLASAMSNLNDVDLFKSGRLLFTDANVMTGDAWFDKVKAYAERKLGLKKADLFATTPMIDSDGNLYKSKIPSVVEIDSLSRMPIAAVDKQLDDNAIGESGNNTEALMANKAKHQMMIQLPVLTEEACMPFILSAHVDDNIQLDAYAPPQKKLAFMNNKLKFKYVPNQFLFLPNNLWYCFSAEALNNKTTKLAEFPSDPSKPDVKSDLMEVLVQNLRGKYGMSGVPYSVLVSQFEGVLPHLTDFYYCKKTNSNYGIDGNDRNYFFTFAPHHKLSRTTIRKKLEEHPDLARAVELTRGVCMDQQLIVNIPRHVRCTPAELYEDLKAMGYDWAVLLDNTTSIWTFKEDKCPKHFLSSMDLLRMRAGLYVPYWYKQVTGVTIDPKKSPVLQNKEQ